MEFVLWTGPGAFGHELLECGPSLPVQLTLAALHTLMWGVTLVSITHALIPVVKRQRWVGHFVAIQQRILADQFGIHLTFDDTVYGACNLMSACLEHAVGALLCLPSQLPALGISTGLSQALARHGALCEVGYELSDVIVRGYDFLFIHGGRARQPPTLLALVVIHHFAGLSTILPLNILLPNSAVVHACTFALQFAALAALVAQYYGYALDVKVPRELMQMKVVSTGLVALMVYTRMYFFVRITIAIFQELRHVAPPSVLLLALGSATTMAVFNVIVVGDSIKKAAKFLPMNASLATKAD